MGEITVTWKRDRHNGREDSRMEEKNTARDAITWTRRPQHGREAAILYKKADRGLDFPLSLNGKIIKCAIRFKIYQ